MWSTNRSRSLVCLPAVLLIVACTCACAQDSAEQLRERVQRGEDGPILDLGRTDSKAYVPFLREELAKPDISKTRRTRLLMALAKLGDGTAFQELNAGIRARSGSDPAASFQHLEYVGGKNSLLLLRELLEDKTPEPPTQGDEVFMPLRTLACFTLSDIASDSPTSRIQCSILTPEKLAAAWKAWFAKHPEALK